MGSVRLEGPFGVNSDGSLMLFASSTYKLTLETLKPLKIDVIPLWGLLNISTDLFEVRGNFSSIPAPGQNIYTETLNLGDLLVCDSERFALVVETGISLWRHESFSINHHQSAFDVRFSVIELRKITHDSVDEQQPSDPNSLSYIIENMSRFLRILEVLVKESEYLRAENSLLREQLQSSSTSEEKLETTSDKLVIKPEEVLDVHTTLMQLHTQLQSLSPSSPSPMQSTTILKLPPTTEDSLQIDKQQLIQIH